MTAKKSVKKSVPAKKPAVSASPRTEQAARKAADNSVPKSCAGNSESDTGAEVIKRNAEGMFSVSVKRILFEAFLIAVVVLALQLGWSAVKLAGRSIEIFRQFRQWQEWNQENIPVPGPDGLDGIRKYIKKNFPRTIPASERETAAQVFADAAAAVDKGGLINRDDVLGYLGENLRPACKAPAWVGFLSNVWTELDLAADASPDALSGALREVSRSLNEARAFLLIEAVPELSSGEAEIEKEPVPAEESAEPVLAPEAPTETEPASAPAKTENNCPSGTCPANQGYPAYNYNYGGWRWF